MNNEIFNELKEKFSIHICDEENERIIYSGKFGTGKSTFLREYFLENESYNCIHLYPVNYSILSNEDIFSYLKFDIIFDLIVSKGSILEQSEKYGLDIALPYFIKNNWFKFLAFIPLFFDKLGSIPGRNLNTILEGIKGLIKEYEEFANAKNGDFDKFNNFYKNILDKEGGLYESNALTEIIRTELYKIKSDFRKNILIIDDLDRLDPEHIFRLLNVFAAHFDHRNSESSSEPQNKFGFDKVILVCDIVNIRSIFSTKYGTSTDFNGYIDKFYSKVIFEHNLSDIRKLYFDEFHEEFAIDFGGYKVDFINEERFNNSQRALIVNILSILKKQNLLNLRNLTKFKKLNLRFEYEGKIDEQLPHIESRYFRVINLVKYLIIIYGDLISCKTAFDKLQISETKKPLYVDNLVIAEIVFLCGKKLKDWGRDSENRNNGSYYCATYEYKGREVIIYAQKNKNEYTDVFIDKEKENEYDCLTMIRDFIISLNRTL